MKQNQWEIAPKFEKEEIEKFSINLFGRSSSKSSVIIELLLQRGITNFEQARNFFRPSLENLHNPFQMKDMKKAVQRIQKAIQNQENILIYGDYDVDGTTAVSLVYLFLTEFYANVTYYQPDRYKEGYGVSFQGIDFAVDNEISLIITLDCGIKDAEKIAYANEKSIDIIICDHHLTGDKLPQAYAILNPKQYDCSYPYKELCGCGVGFKLVQALCETWGINSHVFKYLDLVAVATAADIVPITGENRILCYYGIQQINNKNSDIFSVFLKDDGSPLKLSDLVFTIAPRINAAGRIKHARYAVEFLTEKDEYQKQKLFLQIEEWNSLRKKLDAQTTQEALMQIAENQEENNFTSVVFKEDWHKGVIGIVASKLIEHYHRPTFVFTRSGNKIAGSVRSVRGFDVYKALEGASEFIEQFGGHKYAAGLTILPENFLFFKNKIEEVVKNSIDDSCKVPKIHIDLEISLEDITEKFFDILQQFAPHGPENHTPIFLTKNVIDAGSVVIGKDKTHLKLRVTNQEKQVFLEGIAFSRADDIDAIQSGKPFDIVYSIEKNNWNGRSYIQLSIRDLKFYL